MSDRALTSFLADPRILDTVHFAGMTQIVYNAAVTNYGNPEGFDVVPWYILVFTSSCAHSGLMIS